MMRSNIVSATLCLSFILLTTGCEDIFIEDITDELVTLIAPADSVISQFPENIFIWDKLDGASHYEVIILAGTVVVDTITSKTTYKTALDTGKYEWCVRALSGDYHTQLNCRSLEIVERDLKDITGEVVELIAPLNNLTTKETKQVFLWGNIVGATQYQLIIASPSVSSPAQVVVSKLLTSTTYTAELEPGEYEWCVKAINRKYKTDNSCGFLEIEEEDDGG